MKSKWASERLYPGGEIVFEPLPMLDSYLITYRCSAGDFCRGVATHFERMGGQPLIFAPAY